MCGVPQEPEGLHLLPLREVSGRRHVRPAHPLRGGEAENIQEVQVGTTQHKHAHFDICLSEDKLEAKGGRLKTKYTIQRLN